MSWEIIIKDQYRNWDNDLGGPNEYDTREEALAGIEELRQIGEDWLTAEYDVRELHV